MKTTKAKLQREFERIMGAGESATTEISLISDVATAMKEHEELSNDDALFVLKAAMDSINKSPDSYLDIEGMYYALLSMYYELNGPMHIESIKKVTDVIENYAESYKDEGKNAMPDSKFLARLNSDFVEYMKTNLGE